MFNKEKKHKIFTEVLREDDFVTLKYSIPKFDEYYIGRASLINEVKKGFFGTRVKSDYQSLMMIEAPVVLNYMYSALSNLLLTYNEIKDGYDVLRLEDVYLDAMRQLVVDTQQAYTNLRDGFPMVGRTDEQIEQLKVIDSAEELKLRDLEEVTSRAWLKNASPMVKLLIEIGYTPIWVKYGIRTRKVTLIRQAGNTDAFKVASVVEFIPRDDRKNCSFVHLQEIVLTAAAATALMNIDQTASAKEIK